MFLSKSLFHLNLAVNFQYQRPTLLLCIILNRQRSFGLDFAKICKYGRLPFMRFDILTMSVSFGAHDLSTSHVRDLSLSGQNVHSQPHVFGCQLMAIDHQIPIGSARGIAKRFHEIVGTSREHLFRQR